MPDSDLSTVDFSFDPICPWTWLTSRWIVSVAEQIGIDVQWHALSLGLLNGGQLEPTDETPKQHRATFALTAKALRIIAHLDAEGRNADAGRFYTALGTAIHVEEKDRNDATLAQALKNAGLEDLQPVGNDRTLDAAVTASHERAQSLVAGDTGSPVLGIDGKGIFGPIVSPVPKAADAVTLWDCVRTMIAMPEFFELKRNRDARPQVG